MTSSAPGTAAMAAITVSLPLRGTSRPSDSTRAVGRAPAASDRKSTRLNSSHDQISYAVFCLKKKKNKKQDTSASRAHHAETRHQPGESIDSTRRQAVGRR